MLKGGRLTPTPTPLRTPLADATTVTARWLQLAQSKSAQLFSQQLG